MQQRAAAAELVHARHEDAAAACGISLQAFRARLHRNRKRNRRPRGRPPGARPQLISLESLGELADPAPAPAP